MSNPFESSAPVANQSVNVSLIKILQILFGAVNEDGSLNVLGAGSGGGAWGEITGTITDQTDLVNYIAAQIAAGLINLADVKGGISAAANPNYPAAVVGDFYFITANGRIGGGAGPLVTAGDSIIATADNAGGTQAEVGGSWIRFQASISGITSVGTNLVTQANPGAIRFNQINADNTISQLTAADLLTAIGAATARPTFNAQVGTTYDFVLADEQKIVTGSNAGATTFTIPLNSTQAFPVGATITIQQIGAGQITVGVTGGVTLNSYGGANKLTGQWAMATLIKTATDTWTLAGNLTT